MDSSLQSFVEVVAEIKRIQGSLPARPGNSEVEAAEALVQNVEKEEQLKLDEISSQRKSPEVPEELFSVLQELQKNLVSFQIQEKKREALNLLHLQNLIDTSQEIVQRASKFFPTTSSVIASDYSEKDSVRSSELFTNKNYNRYVKPSKAAFSLHGIRVETASSSRPLNVDPLLKPETASGLDGEKLSATEVARLIEECSMKGTSDLNLQNKLTDKVNVLPFSISKLSSLITLDLSQNQLITLPTIMGGLSSLRKLDLHSNVIHVLPNAIGDLLGLVYLHLGENLLTSLPPALGQLAHLVELNLRANKLLFLPQSIGTLISLKKLNVECNDINDLPTTIGQCSSLVELLANYNRLRSLPEVVGRIESLEILSVRYNNLQRLPTTMPSLLNLKELDVGFNEIESLPRSIGNLQRLEKLDISNNQIQFFPDSFRLLSRLHVLHADENPLEVPPQHTAALGAEEVVQFMTRLVASRPIQSQPVRPRTCDHLCACFKSN